MTNNDPKFLAIQNMAQHLTENFEQSAAAERFRLLNTGESGTGKTYLLRTARKPVHIDVFDPDGAQSLLPYIKRNPGHIIVDDSCSWDDPKNPRAATAWSNMFQKRKQMGYFDHIGTYCIDSITTFSNYIMNHVLYKAGRVNANPQQQDYLLQMTMIKTAISTIMSIPCDIVVNGHLEMTKDEVSGQVLMRLLVTGKLTNQLPLLFSEVYVSVAKATAAGIQYSLLTQSTGRYVARTRIGGEVFETFEEPDIKKLLSKAGMSTKDKPLLTNTEE